VARVAIAGNGEAEYGLAPDSGVIVTGLPSRDDSDTIVRSQR
jgi:hypothetical protein